MRIESAPLTENIDFDNWINKLVKLFNAREHRIYEPTSITVTVGTETGTVSNVQTAFDGNTLAIAEISATPGIDVRFNFGNVENQADTILMRLYYEGSSSHWIGIEAYNYSTAAFDRFTFFGDHVTSTYVWYQITIPNFNNYKGFGSANDPTVILRLNHFSAGNPAHDLFIDYVGLRV